MWIAVGHLPHSHIRNRDSLSWAVVLLSLAPTADADTMTGAITAEDFRKGSSGNAHAFLTCG